MQLSLCKEREYNIVNSILNSLKNIEVEKGKIYEIETPKFKDRLFFECIKAGELKIKYGYNDKTKKEIILFSGDAKMSIKEDITEGMNG